MVKIENIEAYSFAKKLGIKKGEDLIAINGEPLVDILDYIYAEGQDSCVLTIKNKNGETRDVKVNKGDSQMPLGIDFGDQLEISNPIRCANKCQFCFVDQLPKGMREPLYVKDDDYRLSFGSGCYITCTNLQEKDIQRILRYKLSPLYISVHATDHETRLRLLGIKQAKNQMELLKRFIDGGIKLNTQIVLVGGVNDGEILKKSLEDIDSLGENVLSLAVVPVGLTGHRDGLTPINPLTKEQATAAIDLVEAYYRKRPFFCYCSDEMYMIAKKDIPAYDYYGGFDQIENGVGLVSKFLDEVQYALQDAPTKLSKKIALITGVSGAITMRKAAELLMAKWRKIKIDIYPIANKFFGETVTVTGLVTAGDIINQMARIDLSAVDEVIIPSVMLKEGTDLFLDNVPIAVIEKELRHKIIVCEVDGECFVDTIVYGEE